MRCNAVRKDKTGRTIVGNMPEFDENRQFTEAQDLPGHIAKMTKQPLRLLTETPPPNTNCIWGRTKVGISLRTARLAVCLTL